jgi:hypothetical protein
MKTPFVPMPLLAELDFGSEFGVYKHIAPRRRFRSFVTVFQRQGRFYSVTVTGVPTGAFSKNLTAICPGKRMQPCDAAKGGT